MRSLVQSFLATLVTLAIAQSWLVLAQSDISSAIIKPDVYIDGRYEKWQQQLVEYSLGLDSVRKFSLLFATISNLTAGLMDQFPKLESLVLESCEIDSFETNAFRNNKNLRIISLKFSRLRDISSLFQAIQVSPVASNLESLDLSYNVIQDLQPFPEMSRLSVLSLAGNKMTSLDGRIFRNLKSLEQLNLDKNAISQIEPDSFNYLDDLNEKKLSVMLSSNRLNDFKAVMNAFRDAYIDTLDLSNNEIKSLVELDSRFLVSKLRINNNKIESLGSTPLFKNVVTLRELDLSGNLIRSIEPGVFSRLLFPLKLALRSNMMNTNTNITNSTFDWLADTLIEDLDLGDNLFAELTSPLPRMSYLKNLTLSNNYISKLAPNVFENLPRLKKISLSWNFLESIEPGWFSIKNNPNKLIVDLSSNMLLGFSQTISALAKEPIEELYLEHIGFETVEWTLDFIPPMEHLRVLSLSKNNFGTLEHGYFKNAPLLDRLYLQNCRIKNISQEFIDSLDGLSYINLAGNMFKSVPKLESSALETLDISSQSAGGLQVDDFTFERTIGPASSEILPLEVHMEDTYGVKFSPKAFCSRYSDRILIRKLRLHIQSPDQIKCHLKQLRGSKDFGVELDILARNYVNIDVAEFCGCGRTRLLGMKYNITFTGLCLYSPSVKCDIDLNLVQDDCDQQSEYRCPLVEDLTTTTTTTTTISTPSMQTTTTPTTANGGGLSGAAVAAIVIGSALLLLVAISLPFIFNRFR